MKKLMFSLSLLIGEQSGEEEENKVEVEQIHDSSDGEEYMLEVSDSESDGDGTKRQLNTQRARPFAAAAPTVPTPVAQAGGTSSADMPPMRRQKLEGIIHIFGKNSAKSKNGHRWSTVPPNRRQFHTAQHNIIYGRPDPSFAAAAAQTSLESFQLFITDNSVDHIVGSTNDIITSLAQNYFRQDATVGHVMSNEVKALIGVLIFFGSNQDNHKSIQAYVESQI